MDVPLHPLSYPLPTDERILTPGAEISGLIKLESYGEGPTHDQLAFLLLLFIAATAIHSG